MLTIFCKCFNDAAKFHVSLIDIIVAGVGFIFSLAGNLLGALPALPAWRGYGKNSAGKGVTSPALPAWSLWEEFYLLLGPRRLCRLGWGYGDNAAGKGMSSPALPAARALSLAAGPLQDK